MAISTKVRYDPEPFEDWRSYYTKACYYFPKPEKHLTNSWNREETTSYRGDPLYLNVHGKRRRVFNAFETWKFRQSPLQQTGQCCSIPGYPDKWGNNFMIGNYLTLSQGLYPNTPSTYIAGDVCPFITKGSSTVYLNEIREFVERDLFIKANSPVFEGAVFIAELDETLREFKRLFEGAAEGLYKFVHQKKLEKRPWTYKLKKLEPESWWLWFRYFLMPAMMDAEDIIAALKPRLTIDRVQDGDRSDGLQRLSGSGTMFLGGTYNFDVQWKSEYKYGAGGAIDMYHRFDPNEWGFSNWDLLRAGWERIPWSFVFDWFVNVGDWLASLRQIEIDYAQSYSTVAVEAKSEVSFPDWDMDVDPLTIKTFHMKRNVDIEPPTLPLVDKNWRNLTRTLDLTALTIGILRGFLQRR